ncbi:MAG: DoxX family protein [Gemmatimonadaceae bacterium]
MLLFALGGLLHFLLADRYVTVVPPWLPHRRALVYLSGVAELAGAVGLLVPGTRRAAAWGLIVLLVAVFPANLQMVQHGRETGAAAAIQWLLWLRLPVQPLLMWWVWRARGPGRRREPPG